MKENPLDHLRAICLELPEATEQGGVGDPSFKVRDKIFAMQHRFDDRPSMWCKAPPGAQDILVDSNPDRFFVPPICWPPRLGWCLARRRDRLGRSRRSS